MPRFAKDLTEDVRDRISILSIHTIFASKLLQRRQQNLPIIWLTYYELVVESVQMN